MTALGILTIGQAPRPDRLAHDVAAAAGTDVRAVERGALDGLDAAAVRALAPREQDDVLVTMLRDGTSVQVGKAAILDRLQDRIERLEGEDAVDATLLLCTGNFPPFRHRRPLLRPQAGLYGATRALAGTGRVASMIPVPTQRGQVRRDWRALGVEDPLLVCADPYGPDPETAVAGAASEARDAGAAALLLDCFGYSPAMRRSARDAFGAEVLLARTLAARIAVELA
jgi:protein AroM